MLVVLEASAAVEWALRRSKTALIRPWLSGNALYAPVHYEVETISAIVKLAKSGKLPLTEAQAALSDLGVLPVRREAVFPLTDRIMEMRDNTTVYDAAYLALAELLDATLLTVDKKFLAVPKVNCHIEVVC